MPPAGFYDPTQTGGKMLTVRGFLDLEAQSLNVVGRLLPIRAVSESRSTSFCRPIRTLRFWWTRRTTVA